MALHIPYVQEKLRKDFKVAAQNAWVKGSGAYTGEIRCVLSINLFPCFLVCSFSQCIHERPVSHLCCGGMPA